MKTKLYADIHPHCGSFTLNCTARVNATDDPPQACRKAIPADLALIPDGVVSTQDWGGVIFCSQACADREEAISEGEDPDA